MAITNKQVPTTTASAAYTATADTAVTVIYICNNTDTNHFRNSGGILHGILGVLVRIITRLLTGLLVGILLRILVGTLPRILRVGNVTGILVGIL